MLDTKLNQKGFAPIIILVVVLILAVGLVGFAKVKNVNAPTQTPASTATTSSSPASSIAPYFVTSHTSVRSIYDGWKTYTNKKYNFSLKYPGDWVYEEDLVSPEINDKKYPGQYVVFGQPGERFDGGGQFGFVMFNVVESPDFVNLTTQDYVTSLTGGYPPLVNDEVQFDNGIEARHIQYGCQATCTDFIFKRGDTFYDFSTGPNDDDQNVAVLKLVISTLHW